MKNLANTLYALTPTGAMTCEYIKSLRKNRKREQLQEIINYWEGKSKFGRFLSYINPFRFVDWNILTQESKRILTEDYGVAQ